MAEGGKRRLDRLGALLATATAFALSPVLLDLAEHWREAPWSRYSIAFIPICGLAIARIPRGAPGNSPLVLLVAVIAASALLVAGGRSAWARCLIPIAVYAVCRARGRDDWRVAALSLFVIPVPALVHKSLPPQLVEWLAGGATAVTSFFVSGLASVDGAATYAGQALVPGAFDGGVTVAVLFVAMGCMASHLRRRAGAEWFRAPAIGIAAALPVQFAIWCIAVAVLAAAGPRAGQSILDQTPLALGLLLMALVLRRSRTP